MSLFNSVKLMPEDPIFGLQESFLRDPKTFKVNLGVGVYRDDEGISRVLSSVRKAEQRILQKQYDKQYLPILGSMDFIAKTQNLVFGQKNERLISAQTLGGTGALRLGCELFCQTKASKKIYLSNPTWPNHRGVASRIGLEVVDYPYYSPKNSGIDADALKMTLDTLPEHSLVLLQPCCHNPTGCDPDLKTWKEISEIMKKRKLIPFFDLAYLGFGKGLAEDREVILLFLEEGHEMFVATSFSKNFGLYGERVGLLTIAVSDTAILSAVKSQLQQAIRNSVSNPPLQGSRIVTEILSDSTLEAEWRSELEQMRERIVKMRQFFVQGLVEKSGNDHFLFLGQQQGMFSFSGLSQPAILGLREEFGIYLSQNGRINIASLNSKNINFVLDAFIKVISS